VRTQQARRLLADRVDHAAACRLLVRDRAGQFTDAFDAFLAAASIQAVKIRAVMHSNVRISRIKRRPVLGGLINEYEPAA
jgi:hypothetical protein